MDTPLSLCSHSLSPSPCATFKALSLARGDILFCLTDAGCESSFGSQYTYMQTLYSLLHLTAAMHGLFYSTARIQDAPPIATADLLSNRYDGRFLCTAVQ